jgi:hypothetical protein
MNDEIAITGAGGAAMPCLPIIRTLGGCGGTLLARLFGALPDVLLLSETNPRSSLLYGGILNPIVQIRKWHSEWVDSIAGFDEYEIGYPPRFGDMLARVWEACCVRRRTLMVRDFNYVDFVGVPFLWPTASDLSLDVALAGRFRPVDIVLVRFPPAQLASLRTHGAIGPVLTAQRFFDGYHAFLAAVRGARIFRYEDLVADPTSTFEAMCAALGVSCDRTVFERFASIETVTGNLTRKGDRSITAPEPSDAAMRSEAELAQLPGYDLLLQALGYGEFAAGTQAAHDRASPKENR